MTLGRGFFRLWIVVAVLWGGGCIGLLGKDAFKGLWEPFAKIHAEFRGESVAHLDGSRPKEELRQQIITGVNRIAESLVRRGDTSEAQKQVGQANQTADELLKAVDDASAKRADRLHTALIILLVPPAGILTLGLAIAWVASGFAAGRGGSSTVAGRGRFRLGETPDD